MEEIDFDEALGLHVKYFSYLGEEMFGTIVHAEPCTNPAAEGYPFYYIYIEDENNEYNIHSVTNFENQSVRYAAILPSYEVYPDR